MATMNTSLPDELKQFIDAQVAKHAYGSSSEYLRELIRKQRDLKKLRGMLIDGFNSGTGPVADEAFFAELQDIADGKSEP